MLKTQTQVKLIDKVTRGTPLVTIDEDDEINIGNDFFIKTTDAYTLEDAGGNTLFCSDNFFNVLMRLSGELEELKMEAYLQDEFLKLKHVQKEYQPDPELMTEVRDWLGLP